MIAGAAIGDARTIRGEHVRRGLSVALAVAVLAGCQTAADVANLPPGGRPNLEAKFVGTSGSAAGGSAFFSDKGNELNISIWLGSVGPGEFRVVIHERGNCSSPNGFSAGPPWAPPGVPLAVILLRKNDDTRTMTARMPGYHHHVPDGVMGRSVVVHAGGYGSLEAEPGVKNNRIVCAVIGTPEDLFPRLGF